ncbi:hypothetical protein chiPu_0030144, partial [Chiloscyllium punctatum]|nr:hypothetical protein [Chiloscyllium punctatum]
TRKSAFDIATDHISGWTDLSSPVYFITSMSCQSDGPRLAGEMWGLGSVRTRRTGSDLSELLLVQLFHGNDSLWIPNDAISGHITNGRRADIYCGLLEPESRQNNGIQSLYNQWRPWVQMLHP